jgi:ethanolamine utilization protein EutA
VTHDPDSPHLAFPDHHAAESLGTDLAEELAWQLDNVELVTVGVDIGSSTSHLLFSRLHLQRLAQSLSSRFVVVERETLHRSPILLTPYRPDGLIDAAAIGAFVDATYREAGLARGEVDTGAVILTGVALERGNSRAVAELFAAEGGKFVCAAAGHNLEAILAAHGSGAVALSRKTPGPALHLDVGGGTTKVALLLDGVVLQTAAVAVGGRLLVLDAEGRVVGVEAAGRRVAASLGLDLEVGRRLEPTAAELLTRRLARILREIAEGGPCSEDARSLLVTEPLRHRHRLPALTITCSGGASEYLFGRERRAFGDLSRELAGAIRDELEATGARLRQAGEGIRATVIGASQFSVQVSGNTVHAEAEGVLPVHNLPVVHARLTSPEPDEVEVARAVSRAFDRLDLEEGACPVAVSLNWRGEPRYSALRALAAGLAAGLRRSLSNGMPLVLALEADVGSSLGAILTEEFGAGAGLIVLDGVELRELDYVDVGRLLRPAQVVPLVVKSLAFGEPGGHYEGKAEAQARLAPTRGVARSAGGGAPAFPASHRGEGWG